MTAARQRGVALLTAMLIIALAAIIGTTMLWQMNLAMHRSGAIWGSQQAWWYAIGIENWLGTELRLDARHSKIDSLDEEWAQPVDYLPLQGGAIKGRLIDLQGRFNLNNLALGDADAATLEFQRLIELVGQTDAVTAQTVAQSTRDWIDADINPTLPNGAEDSYYLGLTPAYRPGNTLMVSPSELRLVKGMTPALYTALAPYVCTLPVATPINVNTAPAAVLQTLAADLPAGTGEALVAARTKSPWKSVDAFQQESARAGQAVPASRLDVKTHYFLVAGQIAVGESQTQFYSVLSRTDNGAVRVVQHSTNDY